MRGNISLSRVKSNIEDDYILVDLTDELSRVHFCQVKLSLIDFARMLTGLSCIDCEFELKNVDTVGKTQQHKEEILPINYDTTPEQIATILTQYEVDGWRAYRSDIKNSHRRTKDGQMVSFTRFVAQ